MHDESALAMEVEEGKRGVRSKRGDILCACARMSEEHGTGNMCKQVRRGWWELRNCVFARAGRSGTCDSLRIYTSRDTRSLLALFVYFCFVTHKQWPKVNQLVRQPI